MLSIVLQILFKICAVPLDVTFLLTFIAFKLPRSTEPLDVAYVSALEQSKMTVSEMHRETLTLTFKRKILLHCSKYFVCHCMERIRLCHGDHDPVVSLLNSSSQAAVGSTKKLTLNNKNSSLIIFSLQFSSEGI